MPLLWRYLLRNYFQILGLSVLGFISILLVIKFQSIARFAATGAPLVPLAKFVAYQIPFILPLAIPISCLIASFCIFQKMSRSQELTALRATGFSLFSIIFPLLICAFFIGLLNFTVASEIAPRCKALAKHLSYQMIAKNPLCLLQKESLIKCKNAYLDIKSLQSGVAEDVYCITCNPSNQRLAVLFAKKLILEEPYLIGHDVSLISSIAPKQLDYFDHLVIEHQSEMQTKASQFCHYLCNTNVNLHYDHLNLRMLRVKNSQDRLSGINELAGQEVSRRVSLGLAALTFTLVGIAFGIEISRKHRLNGLFWAMGCMAFYLIAFIAAKSLKHSWQLSGLFYLIPHLLILLVCLYTFRSVAKGFE